jgi:hypothetical protein
VRTFVNVTSTQQKNKKNKNKRTPRIPVRIKPVNPHKSLRMIAQNDKYMPVIITITIFQQSSAHVILLSSNAMWTLHVLLLHEILY